MHVEARIHGLSSRVFGEKNRCTYSMFVASGFPHVLYSLAPFLSGPARNLAEQRLFFDVGLLLLIYGTGSTCFQDLSPPGGLRVRVYMVQVRLVVCFCSALLQLACLMLFELHHTLFYSYYYCTTGRVELQYSYEPVQYSTGRVDWEDDDEDSSFIPAWEEVSKRSYYYGTGRALVPVLLAVLEPNRYR